MSRGTIERVLAQVRETLVCTKVYDEDYDKDGIINRDDLCPYVYDPSQYDIDKDRIGDICDDDIDGDGIKNKLGVVDFLGNLIPILVLSSEDNCILLQNTSQNNDDDDVLGNTCDPDSDELESSFGSLQVGALTYYGPAPLLVKFTQENNGLIGSPQRDFSDGTIISTATPQHLFTEE